LFETEARDAVDRGRLTQEECADVIRNSGHSSATSNQHYLKRKAEAAGRNAMATHAKLYDTDMAAPPRLQLACDGEFEELLPAVDDDCVKRRCVRTAWTDDEMLHLLAWVKDYEDRNGSNANKDWTACLASLSVKAECFAPHHLTATGLRDAWRRAMKKV